MTRTSINNRAKIKSIVYLYHHYETTKKNIFPALRDASQVIDTIYIH